MKIILYIALLIFCIPAVSFAILPPELIVTVGTSLVQIFGLVVVLVLSTYSAIVAFTAYGFVFVKRYALLLVTGVTFIAGIVMFYYITDASTKINMQLDTIKNLTTALENAHNENALLKFSTSTTGINYSVCGNSTSSSCLTGRKFYSDSYVIVGKDLVLELDLNRIEIAAGSHVYTHYSFLNGSIGGTPITLYNDLTATSSDPHPNKFMPAFSIKKFDDLSPRADHTFTLQTGDKNITVVISGIEGDFITRDDEKFTRSQSIGTAVVTIDGKAVSAQVYQERTFSDDADEAVYFTNRDTIKAKTVQFMLWSNNGDFYLFDNSIVDNPQPYYKSHTWLLHKTGTGLLEKSFTGTYSALPFSNYLSWKLSMPDFDKAEFTLKAPDIYKSQDGRIRIEVAGEVTTDKGTWSVTGVGHIVE